MISIQSVKQQYNGSVQIDFRNWEINSGEHWLMLGGSGTGKTTLLHIISGLLKPTSGSVNIEGTDLYNLRGAELDHFRGKNIGVIFQQPHLIKNLSLLNNVMAAQYFAGLPQDKKRALTVLDSLDLVAKAKSMPSELSQGQMQRVAIARAMINHPKIVIADEPTSSLDDANTEAVLKLLEEQADYNNATLIIATHDERVKKRFEKQYVL
ncbi:ABC transporter ATP-binding protein [Solitalea canadensis]|uniref:ABC-type antimicrobial peptide transport system, ATPase component n=1 Tax=Solitalea canadensis (strain ATCC 29591 / DSM 3403 / JCM 21819 / LMG 8368 / NBRC 15130 / NCIMB 12057 / USAM 9D) TaxID=929556 RepID=H8KRL0_SOLCM|nr:ABC transporter ATP-binding protein [Solitalea canadensis]AFD07591.1 ABC-type antimicrobial peptide transport system, ATPase component [Solitalea canadensis DSM 3403]